MHDMAECIVGDITPSDNVSKEDKHKMERDAMERIVRLVGDEVGQELFSLWLVLTFSSPLFAIMKLRIKYAGI